MLLVRLASNAILPRSAAHARRIPGLIASWATQRKSPPIIRATHEGKLNIGHSITPCAVMEDGTRLLTQEGFVKAIGRSGKPAAGRGSEFEKVAHFFALDNLKPFTSNDLEASTYPVKFRPIHGKGTAWGYRAELLPKVCEVYLNARDAGVLHKSQEKFVRACDVLMRALAHVGIVALVDEATGYQETRDRKALQAILDAFLRKELAAWASRLPSEFYEQLFRLRDWNRESKSGRRPRQARTLRILSIHDWHQES